MGKTYFLFLWFFLGFLPGPGTWTVAQEGKPNIRVVVDMVQLNVAVTDSKGNYVTGLRPQDFAITEDGIPERIATFAEGNEPTRSLVDTARPESKSSNTQEGSVAGASAKDPPETIGFLVARVNVFV